MPEAHQPISRRDALKMMAGLVACATPIRVAGARQLANRRIAAIRYVSAARDSAGVDCGVFLDSDAKLIRQIALPGRAHGAAGHEGVGHGCLFARRPGSFMLAFDLTAQVSEQVIEAMPGRHFYGHGTYSNTGDYLFATENDYERARGVLGVYAVASGYRRVTEIDVQGVGPHDVVRVPGTALLAVANGGIRTHPDHGREKLNIDSMQSAIVLVDSVSGAIVARHQLSDELHQLSLRHLACTDDGQIWFAGQYEGDNVRTEAIAGSISVEQSVRSYQGGESTHGLQLLALPESLQARTQHYLTSVAVAGNQVIFTSARGGIVFSIDRHTQELVNSISIVDCSGVASAGLAAQSDCGVDACYSPILVSSGTGEISQLNNSELTASSVYEFQWDNHLYRL